jgi:hypothetical protein
VEAARRRVGATQELLCNPRAQKRTMAADMCHWVWSGVAVAVGGTGGHGSVVVDGGREAVEGLVCNNEQIKCGGEQL